MYIITIENVFDHKVEIISTFEDIIPVVGILETSRNVRQFTVSNRESKVHQEQFGMDYFKKWV